MTRLPTPAASSSDGLEVRRKQRVSLQVATLLSLLLHALLAGGLATTSLGILPAPSPGNPSGMKNIFKPKLAADFPLEVSKSGDDAPAHEKPLALEIPVREPPADSRKPDTAKASRTVSPAQGTEATEQAKPVAQLPKRSSAPRDKSLAAAEQLDRRELDTQPALKVDQQAKADLLAAKPIADPAAKSPRPAASKGKPPRAGAGERVTRSASAGVPREVAMLETAPPRTIGPGTTPTPRREPSRPVSAPRVTNLSRRQTALDAGATPTVLAETITTAPTQAANAPTQPQVRPTRQPSERRLASAKAPTQAATSARPADAVADNDNDADAPPLAPTPQAVAAVSRVPKVAPLSGASALFGGSPTALARSSVASAGMAAGATDAVPLPAGPGGTGGFVPGETAADGAGLTNLRPGPRGGRPARGRAAGSASLGSRPSTDSGHDAEAMEGAVESAGSMIAAGRPAGAAIGLERGTRPQRDDSASLNASEEEDGAGSEADAGVGGAPAAPMRAAITTADGGSENGRAELLADTAGANDGGGSAADGRGPEDGNAADTTARVSPQPRSLASRGARGLADARGGAEAAATNAQSEADDTLSTDGMIAVAPALAMTSAGSRRGLSPSTDDVPLAPAATLPRATAFVLPVEGRVREIAEPFVKRSKERRTAETEKTDGMVDRGLDFLRRAQQPDGRWSLAAYPGAAGEAAPKLASDTAATGLALLSFLGAGHDHFAGKHRDTVRRGLEFLLAVQKADGDLYAPADQLSNSCAWLYSHGIATMALCEAVGMTGDDLIRPAAARACGFISDSQHPERGGWRYTPRSDADLSVSGWMLVALRSGQLARVPVEQRTLDGVRSLLDASLITPPSAAVKNKSARFHYNARKPEQRPSEMSTACMTALGTLMRLHTGWKSTDDRVVENGHALAAMRPTYGSPNEKIRDCYLWYYMSQVLVHTGGEEWDSWYESLGKTLATHQETAGPRAGSWDPLGPTPDRWGPYGGRLYVTALHLLTLEVPYRHLPTYSFGDAPP